MSSIQRNSNSFVHMEMLIPKCKPLNYLKSEFMWIGCFENGTTCGVRWQIHKLSQLNAFIIIAILNYHYYNCERMCNKQTNTKNTHRKKLTQLGDGQSFITIKFCLNSVQLHQIACTWAAFECHCQNIFFFSLLCILNPLVNCFHIIQDHNLELLLISISYCDHFFMSWKINIFFSTNRKLALS